MKFVLRDELTLMPRGAHIKTKRDGNKSMLLFYMVRFSSIRLYQQRRG